MLVSDKKILIKCIKISGVNVKKSEKVQKVSALRHGCMVKEREMTDGGHEDMPGFPK